MWCNTHALNDPSTPINDAHCAKRVQTGFARGFSTTRRGSPPDKLAPQWEAGVYPTVLFYLAISPNSMIWHVCCAYWSINLPPSVVVKARERSPNQWNNAQYTTRKEANRGLLFAFWGTWKWSIQTPPRAATCSGLSRNPRSRRECHLEVPSDSNLFPLDIWKWQLGGKCLRIWITYTCTSIHIFVPTLR